MFNPLRRAFWNDGPLRVKGALFGLAYFVGTELGQSQPFIRSNVNIRLHTIKELLALVVLSGLVSMLDLATMGAHAENRGTAPGSGK